MYLCFQYNLEQKYSLYVVINPLILSQTTSSAPRFNNPPVYCRYWYLCGEMHLVQSDMWLMLHPKARSISKAYQSTPVVSKCYLIQQMSFVMPSQVMSTFRRGQSICNSALWGISIFLSLPIWKQSQQFTSCTIGLHGSTAACPYVKIHL